MWTLSHGSSSRTVVSVRFLVLHGPTFFQPSAQPCVILTVSIRLGKQQSVYSHPSSLGASPRALSKLTGQSDQSTGEKCCWKSEEFSSRRSDLHQACERASTTLKIVYRWMHRSVLIVSQSSQAYNPRSQDLSWWIRRLSGVQVAGASVEMSAPLLELTQHGNGLVLSKQRHRLATASNNGRWSESLRWDTCSQIWLVDQDRNDALALGGCKL